MHTIEDQTDDLNILGVPILIRDWMPNDAVLLINAPKEDQEER